MNNKTWFGILLAATMALAGCGSAPGTDARPQARQAAPAYEVWAVDQNTDTLYVLDPDGKTLRTIDGATLGAAKRPHMLWGVPKDEYVYSANTVSNSITVLSSKDGTVKTVINGIGKSPHAAQPNPKQPERIYVANIGPQEVKDGRPDRGETITELVRSAGPKWEIARFLDLKAVPVLADSALYPSRRPVCFGFSQDGRYMLTTLFNGGLAVVDLQTWTVSKSWGKNAIAEHGCGFALSPSGEEMYVTAGSMRSSWLYVFNVKSEPQLLASHDLSKWGQDAHGAVVDSARNTLWVVHRVSSNVTLHPLNTIRQPVQQPAVISFVGKTPDLIMLSPDNRRAYVTLRGPKPAPTIPHATVGETPGIGIIDVASRKLLTVVKLGDQVAADFHGLFIPATQR
jgi:DNA-binding beta-propeller fold protein YncE